MRSGDLKHRIKIQKKGIVKDSEGVALEVWEDFAAAWAAVEPLNGREYFSVQAVNAEVTARVRIRYLPGVTARMQVVYGTRMFDIQTVIDLNERHREMHLMCREVI